MSDKTAITKTRNEVTVGFFVIIGLVFLTMMLFFISGFYLFRPGYKLNLVYDYVDILDRGAPVRMAGVRVGEVDRVRLVYDEAVKKTRVNVRIFIEKEVEVREKYLFKIQGTHILSEPHIEITPVPGDSPLVKPGAVIRGTDPVSVETLIKQAQEIAEGLHGMLAPANTGSGESVAGGSISDLIKNLAKLSESLNKALDGSEDDLKQSIVHIRSSTEALDNILNHIDKGEGTAGKLLMQDELYQELRGFVAEIKAHPWKLLKKDTPRRRFLGIF